MWLYRRVDIAAAARRGRSLYEDSALSVAELEFEPSEICYMQHGKFG